MNEIRSYASLSGSLLARKGGAKPAMRPQSFTPGQTLDDLGWDDHGEPFEQAPEHVPSSIAALTPAPKPVPPREEAVPVHVQQRTLSEHFGHEQAGEEPAQPVAPKPAEVRQARRQPAKRDRAPQDRPAGKLAAFTLRLNPERHLRLRLASAVCGQSSQQLVTAALDAFLENLPEVGKLARQIPGRGAN
jgi:hypothetical protein